MKSTDRKAFIQSRKGIVYAGTLALSSIVLTGCGLSTSTANNFGRAPSGPVVVGRVQGIAMGGQNPIAGANVYLYAANVTTAGEAGYGSASISLLQSGGSPVVPTTDANGGFDLTGLYTCPTPVDTPVYLLITGGDPGLGTGTNPNLALTAALGSCDVLKANAATTFINVNEVTTVAAAYALSGFMHSMTAVGTSSTNLAGLQNAFAMANNIVSTSTGVAYSATPAGTATVPQQEIYALADVIAHCINSAGGSASENNGTPTTGCGKLFAATNNSTAPTDTIMAAVNIAQHPSRNVDDLLDLVQAVGAPFATTLASVTDWSIALNYAGGGINTPQGIAIDAGGNAWIASKSNVVTKIAAATGNFVSGANGYSSISLDAPSSLAVDTAGNVWLANCGGTCSGTAAASSVTKLTPNGALVTAGNFTDASLKAPYAIALDGNNNAYIANAYGNSITKFNAAGAVQSGAGITATDLVYPVALASDSNNIIWSLSPSVNKVLAIKPDNSIQSDVGNNGVSYPSALAVDHGNQVWIANHDGNSVSVFANDGSSVINGTAVGGITTPTAIALDGSGAAWIANANNSISVVDSSGTAISTTAYTAAAGYSASPLAYPNGIAVDASGNVWITNCGSYCTGTGAVGSVTQLLGAATPVVTPIASGVAGNTLAARP